MTSKELIEFHRQFCETMNKTTAAKNADYADGENAFSNFTRVELLGIATTEQGFLTRMVDKLCRIANLVKQPAQVKDESITDTLMDLANYAIILAAYLSEKPEKLIVNMPKISKEYVLVAKRAHNLANKIQREVGARAAKKRS